WLVQARRLAQLLDIAKPSKASFGLRGKAVGKLKFVAPISLPMIARSNPVSAGKNVGATTALKKNRGGGLAHTRQLSAQPIERQSHKKSLKPRKTQTKRK
ncbi:MAG: hypothetical protein ACKN9T_17360, partial [Candidatus Methylumidiphilus sp.]